MEALRGSPILALYVALYREAIREPHAQFQYFRFWSLLEMMARHKKYVGRPLRNWVGEVCHNARNRARYIRDDAEELVFELLREHLSKNFGEDSFAAGLKYGKVSEQLSIWYRRRNCVAHGGDCYCRDPSLPLVKPKYVNCWNARADTAGNHDGYLSTIRFVTKAVLAAELGPSGSGSDAAAGTTAAQ